MLHAIFHLASMNVKYLLGPALVIAGLNIAYTGLLFNRARAFEDDRIRRRTLVAAEIALRATLLFIGAGMVGASLFGYLLTRGFEPKEPNWQAANLGSVIPHGYWPPMLAMFIVAMMLQANLIFLYKSLKILTHRSYNGSSESNVFNYYRVEVRKAKLRKQS